MFLTSPPVGGGATQWILSCKDFIRLAVPAIAWSKIQTMGKKHKKHKSDKHGYEGILFQLLLEFN